MNKVSQLTSSILLTNLGERRSAPRFEVGDTPVLVRWRKDVARAEFPGLLKNLGRGGIMIESGDVPPPGAEVSILAADPTIPEAADVRIVSVSLLEASTIEATTARIYRMRMAFANGYPHAFVMATFGFPTDG